MRRPDLARAGRAIDEFLEAIGAPVGDPELRGTGQRVAEAFATDFLAGYSMDEATILADATESDSRGLVVVSIETVTMCPHHLLPAAGTVHLGYLPGQRVAGFGALARLVDCYAHRLTLQEDLGQNVADGLVRSLGARGAGAVVSMTPMCMSARGERRHAARVVTSAFAGVMASDPNARQELLLTISGAQNAAVRGG